MRISGLASFACICLITEVLSAGEAMDRLRELYHSGRYEEALSLASQALEEATRADSAEIYFYEASVERVAELSEIKMVEIARRYPESPYAEAALLQSAEYQYEIENPARSEYVLRQILKEYLLTSLEPEIRLWLGKNYIVRGEYRSARVELSHGINSLDDFPQTPPWIEGELYYWMGEACERENNLTCAEESYLHIALMEVHDPLTVHAMGKLSKVFERRGMTEEANLWKKKYRDQVKGTVLEKARHIEAGKPSLVRKSERDQQRTAFSSRKTLWVQVGSFSSRSNANNLRDLLEDRGIESRVTRARMRGENYYRVRLGPFKDREEAVEMLRRLRQIGMDGRVMHGD
ncbi:MAG: SPOR domain-containing protein [Candidatus Glassbacteria bacterium]